MPDSGSVSGEQGWTLENVTIAGFNRGIQGRVHVWSMLHCHVHSNAVWGIDASSGNNWTDVHVVSCFLYFNRNGNVYFGGTKASAAVEFVNCRFERAGNNYGSPLSPLNAAAPGLKLESARFLFFANCYTDANTGNGVEISGTSAANLNSLYFANCVFNRDGTGDQTSPLDSYAGVKVKGVTPTGGGGANLMKFANCLVVPGKSDDGGGGLTGPKYGVWFENTEFFQWIGGRASGVSADYYVGAGNNYRPSMVDIQDGMFTLPLSAPVAALSDGMAYFDQGTNRLMIRSGSAWKSVTLT